MLRAVERFLLDYDHSNWDLKNFPKVVELREWLRARIPVFIADGVARNGVFTVPKNPCLPPFDRTIVDVYQPIQGCGINRGICMIERDLDGDDFRLYHAHMFAYGKDQDGRGQWIFYRDTTWICFSPDGVLTGWGSGDAKLSDRVKEIDQDAQQFLLPGLLTFEICHCTNAEAVRAARPESFGNLYRARMRRREPDIIFRTIAITHKGKKYPITIDSEAASEEQMRHHIVRGHFARYTKDAPAFGRIVGTFWIPAHARGSREIGEICKDYRVEQKG